jgi:ferrous iron transport protein B
VVGNPNTGKTTLFNALTGFRRSVANYPGVTVDIGRAPLRGTRRPTELLDLPGTYSLAAVSPDEYVVTSALCCRLDPRACPDVILAIVDAANLQRNMYLLSQLLEFELPVVIALNMIDVARARGLEVNAELLAERLGVPVVPVVATDAKTVPPLVAALDTVIDGAAPPVRAELPAALAGEVTRVCAESDGLRPGAALRLLLDNAGSGELAARVLGGAPRALDESRRRLSEAGVGDPAVEVRARYAWIKQVLDGVVARPERRVTTGSDRIDRVLTNRVIGVAVLLVVLFAVFQSIFSLARPPMEWIETGFGALGGLVAGVLPAGMLQSLIVDGVFAGVGGVLVFLPQILLLFALIAVLEDCGYMARAAFMVDRLMRGLGLSGRAAIPLLSSFACAVPAIIGTRAIADRRERFVTILVIPFMSCSARLPVYVLMVAAFVPATTYLGGWLGVQGLVMLAIYLLGAVVAIPVAWVLKRTAFAGPTPGFVLELPSYKWPRLATVWQRVYLAGREFLVRAGSIILLVNLVVWGLGYFPRSAATEATVAQQAAVEGWDEQQFELELSGAYLRQSYLARIGHAIEPVIKPVGWDWRVGVAVVASFPAREVVVATLSTLLNLEAEAGGEPHALRDGLRNMRWEQTGQPVFTLPVALSIMVFFALCAQCSATLVMIGREMKSWLWPVISFVGMTTLAYFAAWGTSAAAGALGL